MNFTLTNGQVAGLEMVKALLNEEMASFGVLTGYAGTGKTTLIKTIAQEVGTPIVLAPTGKAAVRVEEATELRASTIHRWMYKASTNPKNGDLLFKKKELSEIHLPESRLIILDEASMISETVWNDIWSFAQDLCLKILLVGDSFQLPPVIKVVDGEFKTFSTLTDLPTKHKVELTEVCRQALDSPIIRATMMIRQSQMDAMEAVTEHLVTIPKDQLLPAFMGMTPNRSLIVHKNATRHQLNVEIRKAYGFNEFCIQKGEPLLVQSNNYQADRFNGEIVRFDGWVIPPSEQEAVRDRYKNTAAMMSFGLANIEGATLGLSPEEIFGQNQGVGEKAISNFYKGYAKGAWQYDAITAPPYLNTSLGYCLTCHKSQGSEWDDVLVLIEPSVGGRGGIFGYEGRRWLYTSLTRAKKQVVLCNNF